MVFGTKKRLFVSAAALIAGLGLGFAFAQSAGQVLTTLTGQELITVQPANSAVVAYTTTANLRDGRMYLYNVPLTGFTISMTVSQSALALNPAGTLAAGTVNLPPTGFDGKMASIYSTQTITSLTLATTNGATINSPVTTLTANGHASYIYSLAANTWYRFE